MTSYLTIIPPLIHQITHSRPTNFIKISYGVARICKLRFKDGEFSRLDRKPSNLLKLFVARGIDGKVSALKNKKLIVNEKEAEVVRRIFNYFLEGKSEERVKLSETIDSMNHKYGLKSDGFICYL